MKEVVVKDLTVGQGKPKIAVPLTGKTATEILTEAQNIASSPSDIVEWRIDLFEQTDNLELVTEITHELKGILLGKPLLLTFRTLQEGGGRAFEDADYYHLYDHLIEHAYVDFLDVELYMSEGRGQELIKAAQRKGIKIIMSNHDFTKTPEQAEIVKRLSLMSDRGADICKIAVMPRQPVDVLTLLSATNEMRQVTNVPIVTMSMGQMGLASRLFGEVFGSAITFGALEVSSAPGQLPVSVLANFLEVVSLPD